MAILLFDEINAFKTHLQALKSPDRESKPSRSMDLSDEVLDLLIMAYIFGTNDANEMLGGSEEPTMDEMMSAIEKKTDGKDFRERISEHIEDGGVELIATVADTESIRVYNEAVLNTGIKLGAKEKTWHTMEDEKVRDTHSPLDGITVPIDAYFYTWDGDKAKNPCGFEKASNNCNCRCVLTVS